MAESDDPVSRRILVAVDASRFGLEALQTAASLAASLHSELRAMFVEDINLLRLAGLPFACEIAYSSAAQRQLKLTDVERSLQADADQIRRALADTCSPVRVHWTFEVLRGHVTRMALQAAVETDVLIMGRHGTRAPQQALKAGRSRPILAAFDGSPSAQRALETAALLARGGDHPLLVLLADPDRQRRDELERQCRERLQAQHVEGELLRTSSMDAAALIAAARSRSAALLLVNRDSPLLDDASINTLVEQLDCPVGFVK